MKPAILLLLLLAPTATAFPAYTFDGTLEYTPTSAAQIVIDGVEVHNSTTPFSGTITDGNYAWSITVNGNTTTGTTTALNLTALIQRAIANATTSLDIQGVISTAATQAANNLAGSIDLDGTQANLTKTILQTRISGFATRTDIDTLGAELRSQRTKDQEDHDDRQAAILQTTQGQAGTTTAILGLVLASLALVSYREWQTYRDRASKLETQRIVRAMALHLGLDDEQVAYIEQLDLAEEEILEEEGAIVA